MQNDDPIDLAQLSPSQQLALQQYTSVTNQELEAAIPLLQRSQWNVQIAIAKFFDGEQADPVAEAIAARDAQQRRAPQRDNLQESLQRQADSNRRGQEQAPHITPQIEDVIQRPHFLFRVLLAPINVIFKILSGPFQLFAYLFPFLPRLLSSTNASASGRSNAVGRRALNPRDTSARFKREFEEEYGAHDLQLFENGGYTQALDLAKKELKILLVILLSPEHDENSTFICETLLSPAVIAYLNDPDNKIIVWGGNVQDSEPYKIAGAFKCTKFPFSVLVGGASNKTPIISRLAGSMTSQEYLASIQEAVTKFKPQLDAIRNERIVQASERHLRSDQDTAYERSLAQDRARADERRRAEAEAAETARKIAEEQERQEELAKKSEQWRRWKIQSIRAEPGSDVKDVVRIGLRFPGSAERITRKFHADSRIEELYAFVECQNLSGEGADKKSEKPENFEMEYKFRLVSPFPRQVYLPDEEGTVLSKIGKNGNLIVEPIVDEDEDDDAEEMVEG